MTNKKEAVELLIATVQDGRKISDDIWGTFLQESIDNNTDVYGFTDADQLRDDLRYTINQFALAMKAITPLADQLKEMKDETVGPYHLIEAE